MQWPAAGLSRVPYGVYTGAAVAQQEQQRIYRGATWNYLCLDAELMPWSAKAQGLLETQYAAVGAAARLGLGASIEALRQAGVLDGQALRALARYHRPTTLDPHGRVVAESVAGFELAPVGELIG